MDKQIDYHIGYTIYLDINMRFLDRFIKRLTVEYVLKDKDDLPYPAAYGALRCSGLRQEAFEDYMTTEHTH